MCFPYNRVYTLSTALITLWLFIFELVKSAFIQTFSPPKASCKRCQIPKTWIISQDMLQHRLRHCVISFMSTVLTLKRRLNGAELFSLMINFYGYFFQFKFHSRNNHSHDLTGTLVNSWHSFYISILFLDMNSSSDHMVSREFGECIYWVWFCQVRPVPWSTSFTVHKYRLNPILTPKPIPTRNLFLDKDSWWLARV